ncbi:hypothetical protein WR25_20226 [Diploscapter pachys]|uniref:Suppressor of white apricot N-terminal domain-containing protein n=1 Tax=Diploscapter pachys TaxID=2018661 RepID=A0A2A2LRC3_9BILA|nr:hypothetical protein WR25_20226 [Diploscapter pachys]
MWHEARRQEKLLRAKMVDCSKRAERRRKFYENIRKDPEQFMQVHGKRFPIHADKSIAKAAEDCNILRKWQGDPDVLIDRFDARAHLDSIPETNKTPIQPDSEAEKEELVCDFERYRVLIINEFSDVSEKTYLRKIAEKEFWLLGRDEDSRRNEADKKKKSADSKASIGFRYDGDVVNKNNGHDDLDDDSDEEPEMEDIDVELDLNILDAESARRVNQCGEAFGVKKGLFVSMLRADQSSKKDADELRSIERQKAALAGKDAKQERQMLKRQRNLIMGKSTRHEGTTTLLSFVEKSAKQRRSILDDMEKMGESSSDDEKDARPEFILSKIAESDHEDKEEPKTLMGPQLPNEQYRHMLNLARRDESPDIKEREESKKKDSRSRSPRSPRRRQRSRSRTRTRSRSRSRDRRIDRERNRERSRDRDRKRRKEMKKCRRSSSNSSGEDRPLFGRRKEESGGKDNQKSPSRSPKEERSSSSEDEEVEMLEIRSSMSESEKERIEIENRKRRVKRTKKLVKENKITTKDVDSEEEAKKEIARRIKMKMSKALKKTVEELTQLEEEKRLEVEKERRVRDELLLIEQEERRERERKKRREEREKESDDRKDRDKDRKRSKKVVIVKENEEDDLEVAIEAEKENMKGTEEGSEIEEGAEREAEAGIQIAGGNDETERQKRQVLIGDV